MKTFFSKIFQSTSKFFARIFRGIRDFFAGSSDFLSYSEQKKIIRENRRITRALEKQKKRKNIPEREYLTTMKNPENIVEFEGLKTYFYTDTGVVKSVDGISFDVPKNSTVGIVGESGCGKSVTSLSLMRLIPGPSGQIVDGSIRFQTSGYKRDQKGKPIPVYEEAENSAAENGADGSQRVQARNEDGTFVYETEERTYDITKMPSGKMNLIRGKDISMIFQEPMTSLNPVFTIGNQLDEVVLLHEPNASKAYAKKRSLEMLEKVGIAMSDVVYTQYPHELSGGMRQRVMIAMAIICNPKLIIADEPTTALDVTIQAQILDLFRVVKKNINGSIMLITHDLGVIAEMADYVVIMYAGRIIEKGTVNEIFDQPKHPYTVGLQKSKPVVNKPVEELFTIPGQVPSPVNMPSHCYFKSRCDRCIEACSGEYPPEVQLSDTHSVVCYLYAGKEAL